MLPATERCGNSWPSWNISANPRRCVGSPVTSAPSNPTRPLRGRSSPATARSRVDLPQPEGPSTASTSPSGNRNETSSTALTPSNATVRPSTSSTSERSHGAYAKPLHSRDHRDGGGPEHHRRGERDAE